MTRQTTTIEQAPQTESQRRAAEAAEALAAEGVPVTNRTVRQRAGVAMAIAAEAARQWNEAAAAITAIPETPDTVRARVDGIWREAYTVARDEFAGEREALTAKLRTAEDDRDALTKDITDAEGRLDEMQSQIDAARAEALQDAAEASAAHAEQLSAERSRADKATGGLEAVTAERDRILGELAALRAAVEG